MIRVGLCSFKKNTAEVKCSSFHITSYQGVSDVRVTSLVILTVSTWLRYYLPDFSAEKLLFLQVGIFLKDFFK